MEGEGQCRAEKPCKLVFIKDRQDRGQNIAVGMAKKNGFLLTRFAILFRDQDIVERAQMLEQSLAGQVNATDPEDQGGLVAGELDQAANLICGITRFRRGWAIAVSSWQVIEVNQPGAGIDKILRRVAAEEG